MVELAPHIKCTGCMACKAACKFDAISIIKDELGFAYPVVNRNLCKNCGRCIKVCPSLNIADVRKTNAITCFAAKIQDDILTKGCTSGGIVTACAKVVLINGGVVYGASFVQGFGVRHIRISEISQLDKIKGSKYVESDITDVYQQLEIDIKSGLNVLFIGTPCQVSAICRNFHSDKLLTLSFICGGVPSSSFLKRYICELNICFNSVTNIIFRKGRNYCIEVSVGDNVVSSVDRYANPYSLAFDEGFSVRPSCLDCDYCTQQRVGDVTVGDFWGIEQTQYAIRSLSNVSCLMIHSQNGKELIGQLDNLISEKVTLNDISKYNYRLESTRLTECIRTKECIFRHLYPIFGFSKSVKYTQFLYHILRKMKKLVRKYIRIR